MRRFQFAVGLGFLAALGVGRAWADDDYCRNGSFPSTEIHALGLARVAADSDLHLIQDSDPGCPSDAQRCAQRAYLVHGDLVLTGRSRGAYVCVFFPNRIGGSAGWLPGRDLMPLPAEPTPALKAWSGDWRDGDDSIRLSARNQELEAAGEAYWPGAHPSPEQFPGGPNLGDMSGVARPRGATVVFGKADDCRVELVLIGGYLVASDNNACGGMNVRFDGVYRRK